MVQRKKNRPKEANNTQNGYVFGRRAVAELYRAAPERILRLLIAEGAKPNALLLSITEELACKGVQINKVERMVLDELAQGLVHQGICAEVIPRAFQSWKELLGSAAAAPGTSLILLIEHVSDPQNLGALLRASEAAGVAAVLITRDKTAPLSPAARKASAGASEVLPLAQVGNVGQLISWAKDKGFWIIGSSLAEGSQNLFTADLPEKCILIVGSEGAGLRRLTEEACDICLQIPMQGSLGSLNVSQAASVMLFEFVRRGMK